MGITTVEAEALVASREVADYFEAVVRGGNPKAAANWVRNEILHLGHFRIEPEKLARFVSSRRGAQFAPDGILKYVSNAVSAPEVLSQLRGLLEELSPAAQALPSVPS